MALPRWHCRDAVAATTSPRMRQFYCAGVSGASLCIETHEHFPS